MASAPMAHARRRWPVLPARGAARKIQAKARKIAAHLMEVGEKDIEFDVDRFQVKGLPEKFKTMKEVCLGRL